MGAVDFQPGEKLAEAVSMERMLFHLPSYAVPLGKEYDPGRGEGLG